MVAQDEAYVALYGNICRDFFAGPRDKCMSQCTGCKCSCRSKDRHSVHEFGVLESDWEVL